MLRRIPLLIGSRISAATTNCSRTAQTMDMPQETGRTLAAVQACRRTLFTLLIQAVMAIEGWLRRLPVGASQTLFLKGSIQTTLKAGEAWKEVARGLSSEIPLHGVRVAAVTASRRPRRQATAEWASLRRYLGKRT